MPFTGLSDPYSSSLYIVPAHLRHNAPEIAGTPCDRLLRLWTLRCLVIALIGSCEGV